MQPRRNRAVMRLYLRWEQRRNLQVRARENNIDAAAAAAAAIAPATEPDNEDAFAAVPVAANATAPVAAAAAAAPVAATAAAATAATAATITAATVAEPEPAAAAAAIASTSAWFGILIEDQRDWRLVAEGGLLGARLRWTRPYQRRRSVLRDAHGATRQLHTASDGLLRRRLAGCHLDGSRLDRPKLYCAQRA